MTHRKGAVWTERLVLALILASLGGTLNLVLSIHRRIHSTSIASKTPEDRAGHPAGRLEVSSDRAAGRAATVLADQTSGSAADPGEAAGRPDGRRSWRASTRAIAREAEAAREADRRTAAMETARQTSVAESQAWKRREMLVHQQVAALSQRADKLEQEGITLDAERDVLARERDALKAALGKGSQRQRVRRAAVQGAERDLAAADRAGMHRKHGEAPAATGRRSR